MTSITEENVSAIPIEAKTYRVLNNALQTGRTSFGDLDTLLQEDAAIQDRLWTIRNELESIATAPYSTELGERFMGLTQEWLNIDPSSLFDMLEAIRQYEAQRQ